MRIMLLIRRKNWKKCAHDFKTEQNPSPQYDHSVRMKMKNSLTLGEDEVKKLLDDKYKACNKN